MNQVSSGHYAEDYRIVRPDGQIRWIRDTGFTRKNRNGEVIGFAGVARDITDQKLMAEQILHSQKMESIGTLASGVAHDFNNLLGIIMGQTAWLEENTQGETRRRIESIQQTAERGAALVRQILTFARKGETLRRSVDINALLLEFRPLISQLFPKNIHTEFHLDQNLPPLSLDSTQLHQVVMNLCVNARAAMPEGGDLIVSTRLVDQSEVRTHFIHAEAKQYVEVSVKDTGSGMKEEIRSRIFEPFFTTRPGGEGTGLGLAVASGKQASDAT
jgi:signal transduction histidine kinase